MIIKVLSNYNIIMIEKRIYGPTFDTNIGQKGFGVNSSLEMLDL